MPKKIFLILFFFLIIGAESSAATWSEVLATAERENFEIKSSRNQAEIYRLKHFRSYSNFFPQISANLSLSDSGDSKSYSYGLSASQALFKGLSNWHAWQLSQNEANYYLANLKNTEATVFYNLREAFIDFLISQKNLELQEEILKRRQENTRLVSLLYKNGKEDKGNLLRTRADEAGSQYDISATKRELRLLKLKFGELFGQNIEQVPEEIKSPNNIERPAFESLLQANPPFLMAELQLESAKITQNSSISGFLPSVSLQGSLRKAGSSWPPETDSKSLSLNLSYSLFPGGSNIFDALINNISFEKAQKDFEKKSGELRYALEESFENLEDSREALEVQKLYLLATAERSKIGRAKYLNGLISYDEWDRIESEYISGRKNFSNSQKAVLIKEAAWHKSYGGWIK